MKRVKNPLKKRVFRELLGEWQKYLVIAIFLIATIGFVSGMFVANNSMLTSARNKKVEYNLEDGNFELKEKAGDELIKALEKGEKADIKQYYLDEGYKEADKEVIKAVNDAVPEEIEKAVKDGIEEEVRNGATQAVEEKLSAYADMGVVISDEEKEEQIQSIVDENLQAAIDEYYEDAYKEAYDKYMYSDEYYDVISDAKEEAYKEVRKTVDEEYSKAADKYDLDNPDYKPVKIRIYENFYKDAPEKSRGHEGKIRVYKDRKDIDRYSIHEGSVPSDENEIAIDRMHAANVGIKVGDEIEVGGKNFRVSALIALVDYSTLYEKSTDSMFDAINFDVALVTEEGFNRINRNIHYNYSWTYNIKPEDDAEEKKMSENVMAALISQVVVDDNEIEGFLPNYLNNAIHFATDDMGGDKARASIMLYILIGVLAFIFGITISNTITKESSVIGTLRASGYTRGELVVHYMTMPVLVTLIAAVIGNVLGYTFFKNVVVNMYYNSYSLPTYETIFTSDAFIKTTVVPLILMFVINLFVIVRLLKLSPLRFLRHDLKLTKRKKAIRLPHFKFLRRFRIRVLLQNIPNYIVLFFGIAFVMLMLSMAVGFPESLNAYQKNVTSMMFAKYQVILKETEDEDENVITTDVEGAERFSMNSLEYEGSSRAETISVYGIEDGSSFISMPSSLGEYDVVISKTFSEKYKINEGDTFTINDKYDNDSFDFKVAAVNDYEGTLSVFMPNTNFNTVFDNDEDSFNGYLSDKEITDIDDKYIATTITEDDVLKISRQLDHSIGSYMKYFRVVCIILSAVLIYLLTKIIIEKNENAISMVKILGYENKEISSLYLTSTTIMIILFCISGILLGYFGMEVVFGIYLMSMEGWFDFVITGVGFIKMFMFVFVAYLIVMVFDYNRIKRIPMDEALKNVE